MFQTCNIPHVFLIWQFVADNADRNLTNLNGKSKFHGIRMLAVTIFNKFHGIRMLAVTTFNKFHGIRMLAVTTFKGKRNSKILRSFENLIGNFGGDKRQSPITEYDHPLTNGPGALKFNEKHQLLFSYTMELICDQCH